MKNGQWFQKILQCLIAVTGCYILYRGGGILAETGWLKQFFQSETTVRTMQDAAVGLYFPGYVQSMKNPPEDLLLNSWLKELVPVLEEWYEQARRQQEGTGEASEGQEPEETGDAEEQKTEGAGGEAAEEQRTEGAGGEAAEEQKSEEAYGGTREGEAEEPETEETDLRAEALMRETEASERGTAALENGTQNGEESGNEVQEGETGTPEKGTELPESRDEDREETEAEYPETQYLGTGDEETEYPETEEQETGYSEAEHPETETEVREALALSEKQLEQLQDFDYLLNHYFAVDGDTVADETQIDASALLEKDLSMEKNPEVPQILIYHTHSQEAFLDSVEGDTGTTIIGIGDYLAELLEEKYGYQVIHDTGVYDLVDGVLDRSAAYDYARASVEKILEENPTIEVIIDLHRDGVDGIHFVAEENGKSVAKIMFFNGLSKDSSGQPLDYLYNPYIEENLAFSFQLQLAAQQYYPDFTRNIYLKGQRFNLHLRPRSLLVEAGTQLNTVEEEKNAMEPLADILNEVLSGNIR